MYGLKKWNWLIMVIKYVCRVGNARSHLLFSNGSYKKINTFFLNHSSEVGKSTNNFHLCFDASIDEFLLSVYLSVFIWMRPCFSSSALKVLNNNFKIQFEGENLI